MGVRGRHWMGVHGGHWMGVYGDIECRGGPSIYQGEGPSTRGAPKRGMAHDTSDTRVTV